MDMNSGNDITYVMGTELSNVGHAVSAHSVSVNFITKVNGERVAKFERKLKWSMRYFDLYDRKQNYSLFYIKRVHFDIPLKELINDSIFFANMKPGNGKDDTCFENYYFEAYVNDSNNITKAGINIYCKDGYDFFGVTSPKGDEWVNTYFSEGMDDCFVVETSHLNKYFMIKDGRLYLFRYDFLNGGVVLMPYEEALSDPAIVRFLW